VPCEQLEPLRVVRLVIVLCSVAGKNRGAARTSSISTRARKRKQRDTRDSRCCRQIRRRSECMNETHAFELDAS
jgi:hypothetical protein